MYKFYENELFELKQAMYGTYKVNVEYSQYLQNFYLKECMNAVPWYYNLQHYLSVFHYGSNHILLSISYKRATEFKPHFN